MSKKFKNLFYNRILQCYPKKTLIYHIPRFFGKTKVEILEVNDTDGIRRYNYDFVIIDEAI